MAATSWPHQEQLAEPAGPVAGLIPGELPDISRMHRRVVSLSYKQTSVPCTNAPIRTDM